MTFVVIVDVSTIKNTCNQNAQCTHQTSNFFGIRHYRIMDKNSMGFKIWSMKIQ